MADTATTVF